jgi:hypothetical protein
LPQPAIKINPVIRHEKISSSDEDSDSCQPEEKNTPKSDDFVVVKLVPKGKKIKPAYYVGYVSNVVGENYTIQCLRRYSSSSCREFIFPGQDDISIYDIRDIVAVLLKPKCSRGIHYFSDELLETLSGLH